MKKLTTMLIAAALTLAANLTIAADTRTVIEVKDVETLNDDLNKYSGKVVRVTGKIEDKIDGRSILLESGGLFNDEIVVISAPGTKAINFDAFKEDAKVTVTGTVVMKSLTDFQKEYSWTSTPQIVGELTATKAFLVADEIIISKK